MDVLTTISCGCDEEMQTQPNSLLMAHSSTIIEEFNKRVFMPLKEWRSTSQIHQKALGYIRNFIDGIIDKHKEEMSDQPDMITAMLLAEGAAKYTREDIRDEILTLVNAGSDTSSITITAMLHLLAEHPEAQRKVQEEIDSMKGKSYKEINELQLLHGVFREAMRIYPAAYAFSRKALEDIYVDGMIFPKGVRLLFNNIGISNSPEIWNQPEKFDPWRWVKSVDSEDTTKIDAIHRYNSMPFSLGQRACVGQFLAAMQIKAAVVELLSKFWFEPDRERPFTCKVKFPLQPEVSQLIVKNREK